MKKIFSLEASTHTAPRFIESIKSDVRKYLKRERKKTLPEGVDFWDFDCKVGQSAESAAALHVAEINASLDTAQKEEWKNVYVEILAKPGIRTRKEKQPTGDGDSL